jgi:uncharacterized membrane protein
MRNGAASGLVFGIALAGFWDGISLHSMLQWHHMVSARVPPSDMYSMSVNMLADGCFDLFCWLVTIIGLVMLFREARSGRLPSGRVYFGWILIGGGLFNLVEGVIDHEILGLHHVHPGAHWLAWDIGFLLVGGLLLIAVGWLFTRERGRIAHLQKLRAA